MQKTAKRALRSNFTNIDNYRIHYLDEGRGEVILFVHGIPEWSMTYTSLIPLLTERYRCIVPDHLGFGYSDKDENADLSPAGHAERLLQFIRKLELKNIHMVVHDLGGPVGMGALVKEPGLFRSLIISNSWLWNLEGTAAGRGLRLMSGSLGRWLYLNYGFSVKFMAKNGFADREIFGEWLPLLMSVHRNREERFANYRMMREMLISGPYFDQVLQQLKNLNINGQFIWGSLDKFFDKKTILLRWQKELPAWKAVEIHTAGHFPHMETPEEYAGKIAEFIQ
jgi:pimeloyl-ACP methyl ester carboxylesterase